MFGLSFIISPDCLLSNIAPQYYTYYINVGPIIRLPFFPVE